MPEPHNGELPVEAARSRMLAGVFPLGGEEAPLSAASARVLAAPLRAPHDQPPFDASAMDGYAASAGAPLPDYRIIGESAAGRPFAGVVKAGEAVRIFTGAKVPPGCRVLVQERARREGDRVAFDSFEGADNVRRRGLDFRAGDLLLPAGVRLDPGRIALAAASGAARLTLVRRPRIALLSTGEEIVPAGSQLGEGEIFDSGAPALSALVAETGGEAITLGPVGDDEDALAAAASGAAADLLVTIGGASVGDHDLVKPALRRLGLQLTVDTVRLRPGKPTWFGRLADGSPVLGLPGNPASALVCAELFLRPLIRAFLGLEPGPYVELAPLEEDLPKNGVREHWMRGAFTREGRVRAFGDQDSSLVTGLAGADVLIRRPPSAPPAAAGERTLILRLR